MINNSCQYICFEHCVAMILTSKLVFAILKWSMNASQRTLIERVESHTRQKPETNVKP